MSTSSGDTEQTAGRDDLNSQELRNLASKLAAQDTDEELLAAASGTLSGRILGGYFAQLDDKLKNARQRDAKARAETHYLALLQAQLDNLNRDIGILDDQIDALGELIDKAERDGKLDPDDPATRRLLARSGIPPEEWDDVTLADIRAARDQRQAARDAKSAQAAKIEQSLKEASTAPEVREVSEASINEGGKVELETAAEGVGGHKDEIVLDLVDASNDAGNAAERNDQNDFSIFSSRGSVFGGGSSGSVANNIAPDNPLRDAAPDMNAHYQAVAANNEIVEPEADAKLELRVTKLPGAEIV